MTAPGDDGAGPAEDRDRTPAAADDGAAPGTATQPDAHGAAPNGVEAPAAQGVAATPATADPKAAGAPGPGDQRAVAPGTAGTRAPGLLARLGLAIAHPRWALTGAADRKHAGRSGSDLIAVLAVLMLATQLRGLAAAVWLGGAVAPWLGVRAALRVLTDALVVDLALLLLGALATYVLAGKKRDLGRAFDLACVAALPLVFVELAAKVVLPALGVTGVAPAVGALVFGLSYGWMGVLIALAIRPARVAPARVPAPPPGAVATARWLGGLVAALAVLGVALQLAWVAHNLEQVKPMTTGDPAPAIAVVQIGAGGKLGDRVALEASRGKVTVLDFWATWCKPCLASMPRLDQLARSHPDVTVLAINLDDPAAARALFDQRGYAMTLVYDDGHTDERYGVTAIPHTVLLDRRGVIREVVRGTGTDLARAVEAIRQAN